MALRGVWSALVMNPAGQFGLDPQQYQVIESDIAVTNWKRLRIFMALTLFFEILLLVFNDIPGIQTAAPTEQWLARSYLILHLAIGATALTGVIIAGHFLRADLDQKRRFGYLSGVVALVVLICLSLITGLDQTKTGQISAFVINLLVCGAVWCCCFL